MVATPHPAHRVQRLLWAIGEAHRHRRVGVVVGQAPGRTAIVSATTPSSDTAGSDLAVSGNQPSPTLTLCVAGRGDRVLLSLTGELNGVTAADFLERVLGLVYEGARSIVLDLGAAEVKDPLGLTALDSAGYS